MSKKNDRCEATSHKSYGLEWIQTTFTLEPRWTKDPRIEDVELLVRNHLDLQPEAPCNVKLHTAGAFNKLYKVETSDKCLLMRITLPVDPVNKTTSEVATIHFVSQNTDIPVQKIYAFDASTENELGFEWILMEMLPVGEVVKYQAQLFRSQFSGIGNLLDTHTSSNLSSGSETAQNAFSLEPVVSLIFFWGGHLSHDVPRGPFSSSHDWLLARLRFILNGQERIIRSSEDEDETEDAEEAKKAAERLVDYLPLILPQDTKSTEPSAEATVLFHDDISRQNILVDDSGKLTGVVDWECVSALPVWKSCQLSEFLRNRERNEEPLRENYAADESPDETDIPGEDGLDNEGVNELYWIHLEEYETTVLQRYYLERMGEVKPRWVEESKSGSLKADFDTATASCDGFSVKRVQKWLDRLKVVESHSLRTALME
ncbi:phosphotransferase enzyme family-domain-containing protein [Bisporella sp. PMI_857]|nr:phosphotransferase enzyme family-domain-containing protein [Bisporella sp. PMI_857]